MKSLQVYIVAAILFAGCTVSHHRPDQPSLIHISPVSPDILKAALSSGSVEILSRTNTFSGKSGIVIEETVAKNPDGTPVVLKVGDSVIPLYERRCTIVKDMEFPEISGTPVPQTPTRREVFSNPASLPVRAPLEDAEHPSWLDTLLESPRPPDPQTVGLAAETDTLESVQRKPNYDQVALSAVRRPDGTALVSYEGGVLDGVVQGGFPVSDGTDGMIYIGVVDGNPVRVRVPKALNFR